MVNPQIKSVSFKLLVFLPLITVLACNSNSYSLNDQIRDYFYRYQPTTGEQFVVWADQNLKAYSAQQIYTALINEAKYQAQQGHPNMVGVLSFATREWAKQKNLRYDSDYWLALQKEAKSNLREDPGELQLWPKD